MAQTAMKAGFTCNFSGSSCATVNEPETKGTEPVTVLMGDTLQLSCAPPQSLADARDDALDAEGGGIAGPGGTGPTDYMACTCTAAEVATARRRRRPGFCLGVGRRIGRTD